MVAASFLAGSASVSQPRALYPGVPAKRVCIRYRPRQLRASPVWQVVHDHAEQLPALAPETKTAIAAFLACGVLHAGFTRLHCPDCNHEFLLAFTCKQRGLCASCHQRRTLIEGAFIADTVCAPVPHRHVGLTVPRLIRGLFRTNRALLDDLYLAAQSAITEWLRHHTGHATGQPGLVAAVQTFGDFLFWHPHVHVIATAGVFAADGTFHLAPTGGWQELRELWRHALLRRLRAAGALQDWHIARLQNWRNSGFTLDAGEAPIAADDTAGRRRLAEYLLRAPFSLEKITYNADTASVLYRSERHWRTQRNFEVFSAKEFVAALLAQIPLKGSPQVRYYGWYSNKRRGLRAAAAAVNAPTAAGPPPIALPPPPRRRRTAWRELVKQVWGADPLKCPLCSGLLRPIAVVETATEINAVLTPLGLGRSHDRPFAHGPPVPEVAVLVSAYSGTAYPVDPPSLESRLPYPRPRDEAIRYRAEVMVPGEDFDQTGFELPPAPKIAPAATGQGFLFDDDCSQPDSADGEPVFWTGGAEPAGPAETFVQVDALESV